MTFEANNPHDTWVWNVYTDHMAPPGGAYVPSPRAGVSYSNYAATCDEVASPKKLRQAGVSYRVVYRPLHPRNVERNWERDRLQSELRRLA